MGAGEKPLDFGAAEALAFASLVSTGTSVRLVGQDSRRGTFNHRHAVLVDVEDEREHTPLRRRDRFPSWPAPRRRPRPLRGARLDAFSARSLRVRLLA
jgi:2-oxoglutarate dehydrogenase E1 component